MPRTEITGDQVRDATLTGDDVQDGSIVRADLNTTSTGKAVVRKIIAGTSIDIAYDGADSGTGDVTINLSSTGYLDSNDHRALDQLVHVIAETSYYEIIRSGIQITKEIWWTDAGKTKKIREIEYTYFGAFVSQIITKQYDSNGNVITGETLTEIITRSGSNIASVAAVLS